MNLYTKLPRVPVVAGRQDSVLEASRGKRVLHIGCVDAGLLQERFERHELLHQRIAEVAEDLWGVDIDAEGISLMVVKMLYWRTPFWGDGLIVVARRDV